MMARSGRRVLKANRRSWLELIAGKAPILLIAPHGGRAEFSKSHLKVNDLYTAELTRELAHRLGATAMINRGMDRNQLDLNRIPQLLADAPWILSVLADRTELLARAHDGLAVLIIHGWNVIQPRVDLGIGMRLEDGGVKPIRAERVSASDSFLREMLLPLARQLGDHGIIASFGLRYPGASRDNLLQAFTRRHRASDAPALRRLAELADAGLVEAAQMELSVPLRWPGLMRRHALDCIEKTLLAWIRRPRGEGRAMGVGSFSLRRRKPRGVIGVSEPALVHLESLRYGMEFYDPASSLGGIASFRFGRGLSRASLLLLRENSRVVMFSTEDRMRLTSDALSLGGLELALSARGFELRFLGPAIAVPDSRYCISVEQALASGRLLEISLSLEGSAGHAAQTSIDQLLRSSERVPARSRFGRMRGKVKLGTAVFTIDAPGRVGFGPSYAGMSSASEPSKNLWAYLDAEPLPIALESAVSRANGAGVGDTALELRECGYSQVCGLEALELGAPVSGQPPRKLAAVLRPEGATQELSIAGTVEKSLVLAHRGADGLVTYTTLGFAALKSRLGSGHGAFWISQQARPLWALP